MLGAEIDVQFGDPAELQTGNHRSNRSSCKTVDTGSEHIVLDTPRDRHAQFDNSISISRVGQDGLTQTNELPIYPGRIKALCNTLFLWNPLDAVAQVLIFK